MGYSDFLAGDLINVISPDQIRILNTIYGSSEFMLHMLEELLDITAIESGHLNLELHRADIVSFIRKNATLNSLIGAKKNIGIQVEVYGEIPEILIDLNKVEAVMNNLLSNAIKFSMPDTTVKISIAADESQVLVKVTDQGQGIPSDELHKLFLPFERTTVRATAGEKSTGLGLTIARNIVLAHGGEIWAESTEGEGSVFNFTIPINKPE